MTLKGQNKITHNFLDTKILIFRSALYVSLFLVALIFSGCATPHVQDLSHTEILQPDEEDNIGGTFMESSDIRTIATQMSAALLSTSEISTQEDPVYIAIAPIRNNTRFIIDKDIFMKRLRIELNRVAKGQIRFFSQDIGQSTRSKILREHDEELWDELIDEVADHIITSHVISAASTPPAIAVIPVRNTNLVNLNADTFTALIRAKIAEKARGKVLFLAREKNGKVIEEILDEDDLKSMGLVKTKHLKELYGADYFLSGEFIGKGIMAAGTLKSIETKVGISSDDPRVIEGSIEGADREPNIDKYLNIMLIDADTATVPVEKLIKVEREVKSGLGKSNYILTGELSGLSKAAEGGLRSDYIIMSFQLVDPFTNEVLWEDAYETKKRSSKSTLYR